MILETSALSRDSFTAVPMVANAVTVPTDNDKVRDITVPKIIPVGDESVGVTTGGGSKHGSGNDTFSATKLEPGSGLFVGKKILVVDDAVSILKLMSHTLKSKAEAIVTQAKDGQQAVEECEKQDFDLILTDIQMPVLDGFGEAKCIRAMETERGLPRKIIVGISANNQVRLQPNETNQKRPRRLDSNLSSYNYADLNVADLPHQMSTIYFTLTTPRYPTITPIIRITWRSMQKQREWTHSWISHFA